MTLKGERTTHCLVIEDMSCSHANNAVSGCLTYLASLAKTMRQL